MSASTATVPTPAAPTFAEVAAHRSFLIRFAQRRLHDPVLAEDVVHDVFEAVLTGRAQFGGRAALRSWLTAVLKHKIVDLVRERAPYQPLDDGDDTDDDTRGHHPVCPQPGPDQLAEQRQRLALTLRRIEALPAGLRDAMRLRVLQDLPTEDVCAELSITQDNLFVRLHRARRQLAN
jgi:RNA polymerase sigma-70 factor (ECF subfamily)